MEDLARYTIYRFAVHGTTDFSGMTVAMFVAWSDKNAVAVPRNIKIGQRGKDFRDIPFMTSPTWKGSIFECE